MQVNIMTTKHTQGEWFISGGMVDGYELRSSNGEVIISKDGPYNGLHHEANAKLIAAAPDLLQTLNVVLEHIKHSEIDFTYNDLIVPKTDVIKYIEMTIQKATS